jgi:hypothetical protein
MPRPEAARRITAELVDLYKRRARRLRRDTRRELWRAVWLSVTWKRWLTVARPAKRCVH